MLYLQSFVSLGSQIIDSIIEESQKGNGGDDSEVAQLLDQLHVDVKAEPQPQEVDNAQDVPADSVAPPLEPQLAAEKPEEQQENAVMDGACALPAAAAAFVAEPADSAAPSSGSREGVQPPDITSTVGAAGGDHDQGTADILDQVPFQDRQTDSNSPGPLKPPRQFTVEPDIVASTKKPPPSRPPPPTGGPPPRPPPPSWQNLPSKKSQECLRLSGLEGENSCSSLTTLKYCISFRNIIYSRKYCQAFLCVTLAKTKTSFSNYQQRISCNSKHFQQFPPSSYFL